jgi:Ca2+:H+ antiporter
MATVARSGAALGLPEQWRVGPKSDGTHPLPGLMLQACATATFTRHINSHTPNGRRPGGWYLEGIGRSRRFPQGVQLLSKLEFQVSSRMNPLLQDIRHTPLLWLLVFVPVVFLAAKFRPEAQTLLFVLSVLAIVPLTVLLSHATESVAAKIGDALGGLLNATLGNLAELIIALTALRAGQYMLVKASIAGPIVTNTLFILGTSFLLGGLRHHEQEYNRVSARMQASLLFIATVALLIPSAVSQADSAAQVAFTHKLSLGLALVLIATYALSMLFSLKTHRQLFASAAHTEAAEQPWPMSLALATLAGATALVAVVSDIFVESVQKAAEAFGMSPAFVGFIIVALVGGASAMPTAFSGARRNRLDLSVGIALGSASQIALFVAPMLVFLSYFIGPAPMDLQFWPGAVVMILISTLITSLVTNTGRSAWFTGVLVLTVYLIFAMTLYLLPPRVH